MKEVFCIAFPDGTYLDKDGKYSLFFFAKMFDSESEALDFAFGEVDAGVHFRIDKLHVQFIL